MIVVADTSPINYLVQIGHANILRELFARVLIPPAVVAELAHLGAPEAVRRWALNITPGIEVVSPQITFRISGLDPGESDAINLAMETGASGLLIDDQAGRREAGRRGLLATGTISVLDAADRAGLLEFDNAVFLLRQTNFRISQKVLDQIRQKRTL